MKIIRYLIFWCNKKNSFRKKNRIWKIKKTEIENTAFMIFKILIWKLTKIYTVIKLYVTTTFKRFFILKYRFFIFIRNPKKIFLT